MASKYPVVDFQALPPDAVPSSGNSLGFSAAPVVLPAAADSTPTVAQLVGGTFDNTAATGDNDMDLPTAVAMVAGLDGALVGTSFEFHVVGDAASSLDVDVGVGGTALGDNTVAAGTSARFQVRLTNVTSGSEAYTLTRLA